jgi:hypothetical protein
MNEEIENPIVLETGTIKHKRRTFCLAKKHKVVNEAESATYAIVGKKYSIDPRNIRRWKVLFEKQDSADLLNNPTGNNTILHSKLSIRNNSATKFRFAGAGRRSSLPAATIARLKEFLQDRRDGDFSVSVRMLALECRRFDPTISNDEVSTEALRLRIHRLLDNWDFSWRRKTHKAQLTRHSASVIADFQAYVNWKIQLLGVPPGNVYNADQTNVFYSMESSYTYAERGAKTVAVKGADSTARLTVMLCANMEGGKVAPYLIFKGSTNQRGRISRELRAKDGYPQELEYAVQARAWMDEAKMIDWIERVWAPHIIQQPTPGVAYLILDECRTHLTEKVRAAFSECGTEVDYIPGGYTCKVQMLDVGVNKPFKNNVTAEFNDWIVASGDNIKPRRQDVSVWIDAAWKSITVNNIKNSWRAVGITCAADNEEDNVMDLEEEGNYSDDDPLIDQNEEDTLI